MVLKKTVNGSHFLDILQSQLHIRIEQSLSDLFPVKHWLSSQNQMPSVNVSILSILEWFQEIKPIICSQISLNSSACLTKNANLQPPIPGKVKKHFLLYAVQAVLWLLWPECCIIVSGVCVCMCCGCVCACMCMHKCVCVCVYVCICVHKCVYVSMCALRVYMCIYVHTVCVSLCMCMCVCAGYSST